RSPALAGRCCGRAAPAPRASSKLAGGGAVAKLVSPLNLHARRSRPSPSSAADAAPVVTSPTAVDPTTARAMAPGTQGEPGSPPDPPRGPPGGVWLSTRGSTLAERVGVG